MSRGLRNGWFPTLAGAFWFGAALALVLSAAVGAEPRSTNTTEKAEPVEPPIDFPEGPPFAPSLAPERLAAVRDHAPLPTLSEKNDNLRDENEFLAYCEAVINAHNVSVAGFANTVKKEITFAHLHQQPRKHRGAVVRVTGRIRRLRELEPPAMATQAGVEKLYEAWLFNRDLYADKPFCLVFTHLPKGLEPSEQFDEPPNVSFDGYFFKLYRYEAADPRKSDREAPLLIGHSPVLKPAEESATAKAEMTAREWALIGIMGFVAVLIGSGVFLAWWMHRSDSRVGTQLAGVAAQRFAQQAEEGRLPVNEGERRGHPDPNLN